MLQLSSCFAVGRAVRRQRKDIGLTQGQLAERAGVSRRLIASLEQGKAGGIGLDKLLSILDALHITLGAEVGRPRAQAQQAGQIEHVREFAVTDNDALLDRVRRRRRSLRTAWDADGTR